MKAKSPYLVIPAVVFMGVTLGLVVINTLTVSFRAMRGFIILPGWSLKNYVNIFSNWDFFRSVLLTLKTTFIVLAIVLIISYPVAYFLARIVKSERLRQILLMLCIIPFWTSYITRMITWIPILGDAGLVNHVLMKLGLISKPLGFLLFSQPAMIFVMVFLYSVFCVGPIFFSMSQIDEEVIDSAHDLGAGSLKTFLHVIVPLSVPGVATGALFVIVMVMGEYATASIIGGNKSPLLGNSIMANSGALQWTTASAFSVLLIALTLGLVVMLFRIIDIRKQLK
jgi:putative spermidine/putrescine transport system permease protein